MNCMIIKLNSHRDTRCYSISIAMSDPLRKLFESVGQRKIRCDCQDRSLEDVNLKDSSPLIEQTALLEVSDISTSGSGVSGISLSHLASSQGGSPNPTFATFLLRA